MSVTFGLSKFFPDSHFICKYIFANAKNLFERCAIWLCEFEWNSFGIAYEIFNIFDTISAILSSHNCMIGDFFRACAIG